MLDQIRYISLLAGALLVLPSWSAFAQPSSLTASLAGSYRPTPSYTCQPGPENRFYPEVQVDSRVATFADQTLSVHGGLYYAYWNDGVNEVSKVRLCSDSDATYSFSEHTAGVRLFVTGEEDSLPIIVSTGLARQFVFREHLGGEIWGREGHDAHRAYTTAEVGLHLRIPLGAGLKLQGGVRRSVVFPLSRHVIGAFIEDARQVYQVGIAYTLL